MSGSAGLRTRGHATAVAAVSRAVASERPPHALLLVGPPQVGKATLAFDLAAGLLCLATDPASRPCRNCAACRKIDHGNHPDLHLLAPEGAGGQIRLAQVQALLAQLSLLPLEGRFRIAVVEQAQRLNQDAQNALLKTLEEPPARVCLVLAADESANLLPTLISRCARLRLSPPGQATVAQLLIDDAGVDPLHAAALARLSGGRPGRALALAGRPDVVVTQQRISRVLLDLLSADRRTRLAAVPVLLEDGALLAGAAGDAPAHGSATDGPGRGRKATRGTQAAGARQPAERRAAVAQLLAVWRDLARDAALAAHGGRAELRQQEQFDELGQLGPALSRSGLATFLGRLDEMARALDSYANPELVLDVLLLAWPRPAGGQHST